jgi:hypothetical protein
MYYIFLVIKQKENKELSKDIFRVFQHKLSCHVPSIVMPRFFSGSFLVLFIQKAFFTRILRSWSRQVGKK